MIPKVIHYCWFGGGPIPEKDKECIESWKKYCPDYAIIKWDESNYDIHKNKYMEQAYNAKKWGFVPDFARLDIIYQHGGIYLDTDVEIVRTIDDLLENHAFMGFENGRHINPGQGFGAEKGSPIIKLIMESIYNEREFIKADGTMDTTASPVMNTNFLVTRGLVLDDSLQRVEGMTIYPSEFFCPIEFSTGKLNVTDKTYSIHWYNASWFEPEELCIREIERKCNRVLGNKVGHIISRPSNYYYKVKMHLRKNGLKGVMYAIKKKLGGGLG